MLLIYKIIPVSYLEKKHTIHSFLYSQKRFFFLFKIYLFVYGYARVFVACCSGFLQLRVSRGCSPLRCTGCSLRWLLLLQSTGSRLVGFSSWGTQARWFWLMGPIVVASGGNCSAACGIFPDQGSNPCPLPWQADSYPLYHTQVPRIAFYKTKVLSYLFGHTEPQLRHVAANRHSSCGMRALELQCVGCGMWILRFLEQGSNLHPLQCKADS